MATWNGDHMLVQHKCGQQVWCASPIIAGVMRFEFRAFAILGAVWWKGDVITACPRCGEEYHPYMSKQWVEA